MTFVGANWMPLALLVSHTFDRAIFAIFAAIATGLLLGRISVRGVSLGMAGIFVTGIILGRWGFHAGSEYEQLGVVLLLYGIGLGAGPTFFRAMGQYGRQALAIVVPMVLVAALLTVAFIKYADLPLPLAIGCLTGAMKSSSAFATALYRFPEAVDHVAVGFGFGYPLSLVIIVLTVQLIPLVLRKNLARLNDELEAGRPHNRRITRRLVVITNHGLIGQPLAGLDLIRQLDCRIQLLFDQHRLLPIPPGTTVREGMVVLLVGPEQEMQQATSFLGRETDQGVLRDAGFEQSDVMITSPQFVGKSLGELNLPLNYGVVVRHVTRLAARLVPHADLVLHARDVLQVDGPESAIQEFARAAGNRPKAMQQTDMFSLSIGIALGLLVGSVVIDLPGGLQFNLGLAGGPLVMALLLGHYGHLAGVVGQFPPATQLFLIRFGLCLLLAASAIHAGPAIEDILSQHGVSMLAMTLLISGVAIAAGLLAARLASSSLLQTLASLAGGMNATPAHERIAAQADSDLVLVMFTTAYVFAMLLMVFTTEILIAILHSGTD